MLEVYSPKVGAPPNVGFAPGGLPIVKVDSLGAIAFMLGAAP